MFSCSAISSPLLSSRLVSFCLLLSRLVSLTSFPSSLLFSLTHLPALSPFSRICFVLCCALASLQCAHILIFILFLFASPHSPFPGHDTAFGNTAEENGQDEYQSLEDLVGQSLSLKEVERALPVYLPDGEYDDAEIYGAIKQTLQVCGCENAISKRERHGCMYTNSKAGLGGQQLCTGSVEKYE